MDVHKLAIFDFDDTLFKIPRETEENFKLWEVKKGEKWPHNSWWDQEDSLDYEVFDIMPNANILREVNKAFNESNTRTVLLSGRPKPAIKGVENLLEKYRINEFDDMLLNPHKFKIDLDFKLEELDKLAKKYDQCYEMDFWDDRGEYAPIYNSWGIKNFGINFNYYLVNI